VSAEVDSERKRAVLTDYHGIKAYRESKLKHPRGLDEEEWPDLFFGWFFFGEDIEDSSFVRSWEVGSSGNIIIQFIMY
jgi:hypothetical protein